MFSNKRGIENFPLSVILGVSLAGFGLLTCGLAVANSTVMTGSHTSCTVMKKDDTASTKGQSSLFVHTEGCNGNPEIKMFSVASNHSVGYPEKELTFEDIEVGKTYDFETRGFQVPVFHTHETVIKIITR